MCFSSLSSSRRKSFLSTITKLYSTAGTHAHAPEYRHSFCIIKNLISRKVKKMTRNRKENTDGWRWRCVALINSSVKSIKEKRLDWEWKVNTESDLPCKWWDRTISARRQRSLVRIGSMLVVTIGGSSVSFRWITSGSGLISLSKKKNKTSSAHDDMPSPSFMLIKTLARISAFSRRLTLFFTSMVILRKSINWQENDKKKIATTKQKKKKNEEEKKKWLCTDGQPMGSSPCQLHSCIPLFPLPSPVTRIFPPSPSASLSLSLSFLLLRLLQTSHWHIKFYTIRTDDKSSESINILKKTTTLPK